MSVPFLPDGALSPLGNWHLPGKDLKSHGVEVRGDMLLQLIALGSAQDIHIV